MADRKKILILCYDFPPLRTIGAQRPASWVEHLPQFGFDVVVVTRNWSENIRQQSQKLHHDTGDDSVEETVHTKVYKFIQPATKRSRLLEKHGLDRKVMRRKALTFWSLVRQPVSSSSDELHFLHEGATAVIPKEKPDLIIATGNPFILFKYAHLLSDRFNIPWVADYRDGWINNHTKQPTSRLERWLWKRNKRFQREWLSNCAAFTTVSEPLCAQLEESLPVKGHVVRNGVEPKYFENEVTTARDTFNLLFTGTVYPSNYVDILFNGLRLFIEAHNIQPRDFQVQFLGALLTRTSGTDRITSPPEDLAPFMEVLRVVSHAKAIEKQCKAGALLNLIPGSVNKGIFSGKIFEYLYSDRPIITIESEPQTTPPKFYPEQLNYRYSAEGFAKKLKQLFEAHQKGEKVHQTLTAAEKQSLTRAHQTQKLAEIFHTLIPTADV